MPNPKTIEELLKMKPCPFKDGQKITGEDYECFRNNYPAISSELGLAVYEASLGYEIGETFKMPDGYYLPPDKQLGLPLGEWTYKELYQLVERLPHGTLIQYFGNKEIAEHYKRDKNETRSYFSGGTFDPIEKDYYDECGGRIYAIYKQPPSLYNPLDQQTEEVLMENSSANEKQPAKETEKMALPWQDINEMPFFTEGLGNFVLCRRGVLEFYSDPELIDLEGVTKFLLLTSPEAKTVEVPVEPVMVSVQEFARNPVDKWFTVKGKTYYEYTKKHSNDDQTKHIVEIISAGHPIYASDPTAWLAIQAEQEGKSE